MTSQKISLNGTEGENVVPRAYREGTVAQLQRDPGNNVVGFSPTASSQTNGMNSVEGEALQPRSGVGLSTISSNGNTPMNSGPAANPPSSEEPALNKSGDDPLPRRVFWLCGLLSFGLIAGVLWRNWSTVLAPQSAIANSPSAVAPAPVPNQTFEQIRPTSANVDSLNGAPSPGASVGSQVPGQASNFNSVPPANSLNEQAAGQEILARAEKMVWSDQATPYRDAILEAKKIPPNDPAYQEAQQDITEWSQIILKIAQQRANQKQWDIAIMAADLVPLENQELRAQAQAALTEWCPMIKNQPVQFFPMLQAKNICSQQPL